MSAISTAKGKTTLLEELVQNAAVLVVQGVIALAIHHFGHYSTTTLGYQLFAQVGFSFFNRARVSHNNDMIDIRQKMAQLRPISSSNR